MRVFGKRTAQMEIQAEIKALTTARLNSEASYSLSLVETWDSLASGMEQVNLALEPIAEASELASTLLDLCKVLKALADTGRDCQMQMSIRLATLGKVQNG